MNPVDVFEHVGVNAWFPRAPAALSPADDAVQEADAVPGAGQRAPRVPLFGKEEFTQGSERGHANSCVTHAQPLKALNKYGILLKWSSFRPFTGLGRGGAVLPSS